MVDLLWESGLSLGDHLVVDVVPPGRGEIKEKGSVVLKRTPSAV